MILSEHLVKCDTDDRPFDTYWYKYTIGRLQQVFLAVSLTIHIINETVTFLIIFSIKIQVLHCKIITYCLITLKAKAKYFHFT